MSDSSTHLWSKVRAGLTRTRERLGKQIGSLLSRRTIDPETLLQLEEALLAADIGPATTELLIQLAEQRMKRDSDLDLRQALELTAAEIVGAHRSRFEPGPERPWVALLVGVNGAGKTTLAGKLAARTAREGHSTLLVAADTFRAAATEQLDIWAERSGAQIMRGRSGADPASVVHDALEAARARGIEVVIVDTAGRLHTRHNLMAELEKVNRICARIVPGAPHHALLVLDATLGQNGLQQAREFQRAAPLTSIAVTKLDGTARGGIVLAIADQLAMPISLVGLGEGLEDLETFEPELFARGLFD